MTTSVLSVCVNEEEHSLLEAGEIDVLEQRVVTIPAKHWKAFEAWAHRPARKIAALEASARKPPKWT